MAVRSVRARISPTGRQYENPETLELVQMVAEAAELVRNQGEKAFAEFRQPDSRWRKGDRYVFVLDPDGFMQVHPDPELEGHEVLDLKDAHGKPIIRGLIAAALRFPDKPEGWFHYQWPAPESLFPQWKSSHVRVARTPSGKTFIVGSGLYNNRMERAFVVDLVDTATELVEEKGTAAFPLLRDPKGPFIAKDAYVFILDTNGVQLLNPAFSNLEGMNLRDLKDSAGKHPIREILKVAESKGSGWVDYLWPRPGESVSTRKSTYVRQTTLNDQPVIVGCGTYLEEAQKARLRVVRKSARELESFVRDAAKVMERQGDLAFEEFRRKGSKWLEGDLYLYAWTMDGHEILNPVDPAMEGQDLSQKRDILGRPVGQMILEVSRNPKGEGWIHYMYPRPGELFPAWKSAFLKRVKLPDGQQRIVGAGLYNMQIDRPMLKDVVDRAASLVEQRGPEAFPMLRDPHGPFRFMDVYLFVQTLDGTEVVNGAFPSLEGRNLMEIRDLNGVEVVRKEIEEAEQKGESWLTLSWQRPGSNAAARKLTYVKKAIHGGKSYFIGSGIYVGE
jgi:signal transduction histidine kinase